MHPLHLAFLAEEIARERVREASRYRFIDEARRPHRDDRLHPPAGRIRRVLAHGAAAVSRRAAVIARRLDERSADDFVDRVPRPSGAA